MQYYAVIKKRGTSSSVSSPMRPLYQYYFFRPIRLKCKTIYRLTTSSPLYLVVLYCYVRKIIFVVGIGRDGNYSLIKQEEKITVRVVTTTTEKKRRLSRHPDVVISLPLSRSLSRLPIVLVEYSYYFSTVFFFFAHIQEEIDIF